MTLTICRLIICGSAIVALTLGAATPARSSELRGDPASFEFGSVPTDAKVHGHYWIANDGADTIQVVEVKPQCGCTTTPLMHDAIPPHDSLFLEFALNTKNMHGWVNKLINIHYDDTLTSPLKVYFSAQVGEPSGDVVGEPSGVDFSDLDKSKEDITLQNTGKDIYVVELLSPPTPYIAYSFDRDTIPPGEQAILTVNLTDSVPLGLFQTSMTLSLNGRVTHRISIPIKGTGYVR